MTSGLVLKVTGSGSEPDSSNRRLVPWELVHHISEVPTPEPGSAKSVIWFVPPDARDVQQHSSEYGTHLPIKESLEELEMQLRNQLGRR